MGQVSRVLRRAQGGYVHWCPGCKHAHYIRTDGEGSGPRWTFDGNVEAPTFGPSVRIFTPAHIDEDDGPQPERTDCHYFVKAGQIEFCGDSAHALAGQTVPLPDLGGMADYGWPE